MPETLNAAQLQAAIWDSIKRLDRWLDNNGWAGYDPYDILGDARYRRLSDSASLPARALLPAINYAQALFPLVVRNAFHIRKEINAKAMGLFARGYIDLHKLTGEEKYLKRAEEALDWLERHPSKGQRYLCWGYPFDWQSLHFLPAGTPSAVVSACVGDAFFSFYRLTGNRRHLDICRSICDFFINELNIDHISADKLCFSYTPKDKEHVHNANIFAAEFLIRTGTEIESSKHTDCGMQALNYTLGEQNHDGSFYYFGAKDAASYHLPEERRKTIDHYHTGFVLRSLHSIYQRTGHKPTHDALSLGYRFYKETMFQDKTMPRMTPQSIYPINIHSCAEAILCMSTLSDLFPDALEYARNAFLWTRENMQGRDGHFYYIKTRRRTVKIPYIRWGQAWMMRALAALLNAETREAK